MKFILQKKSPLVIYKSDYDFSQCRMQHFAKYIDAAGKKEKVKAKDIKEYGFTYAGRDFVYCNVKLPVPKMPFIDVTGEGFYELAIDGKCRMFYDYEEAKTVVGGMPIIATNYVLVKGDLKTFKVQNTIDGQVAVSIQNGMSIEEFFNDCETLVSKLKNNEFKKDKYIEGVNFYNLNCGK